MREQYQAKEYVKAMRLMWADWDYTKKYGIPSEANDMGTRLFNAYWSVELLFKGEEEFEKLAQTFVEQYPSLFV